MENKGKKGDPVANIVLAIVLVIAIYYILLFPENLIPDASVLLSMMEF